MISRFPVDLAVVHDPDRSEVVVIGTAAEEDFALATVALRPEHNNTIDAIRIALDPELRDDLEYPV